MKLFITGSDGFIGSELIAQCKKQGIECVGADVKSGLDIRSKEVAAMIPENADAVVHLAGLSRDADCKNRPYECFETNVMGTLNLMRCAAEKRAKQFIFASSEWVYDSFPGGVEKDEDAAINIANHTSEYALSKLVSETNIRQQCARGFSAATILRFGIIYGPRPAPGSAVESIMHSAMRDSAVTVGSLKSGRRFVHVSDVARGIIASIGQSGFAIFNLTGDRVITLGDIVAASENILGKKVHVTETNPAEVSVRNPSNAKAQRVLGWRPTVDLAAGLQSLLEIYSHGGAV